MKKHKLKETALIMIKENGLINLTRHDLCKRVGIPNGSFTYYAGCNFTEFTTRFHDDKFHQISKKRIKRKLRKQNILLVAVDLAEKVGYMRVSRRKVAKKAEVSISTVDKCFGGVSKLRNQVLKYAIKEEILPIILEAIVIGDKEIFKISPSLKLKVIKSMLK